jgi:hypothetical protein
MGFPEYWVSKLMGIVAYAGPFAEKLLCEEGWTERCTDPLTAYYDIVDPESEEFYDDHETLLEMSLAYPYIKMRQLEKYWATQTWEMINTENAKRTIGRLSELLKKKMVIGEEEIDWFIREEMNMKWRYPRYHLIPKTVRMKTLGTKVFRHFQLADEGKWRKLNERIETTGRIWS